MTDTKLDDPRAEARKRHGPLLDDGLHAIAVAEADLEQAREDLEDAVAAANDDDLSYSVIAEMTGFSKQHVGYLVNRARSRAAANG